MQTKSEHVSCVVAHMAKRNRFRDKVLDRNGKDNMGFHRPIYCKQMYNRIAIAYREVICCRVERKASDFPRNGELDTAQLLEQNLAQSERTNTTVIPR